jgi:uncharacterized protein with HEPN domain
MKADSPAHLHDVRCAGYSIREFITGKTYADYTSNDMLRSAVERKFQVMGEALNRIKREDPELLAHIRDHSDIIAFRNILVHGYDAIDDRIVWSVIQEDLDPLIEDVEKLLS